MCWEMSQLRHLREIHVLGSAEGTKRNGKPDREKYDYRLIFHGGSKVTALLITLTHDFNSKLSGSDDFSHNFTKVSSPTLEDLIFSLPPESKLGSTHFRSQFACIFSKCSWKVE